MLVSTPQRDATATWPHKPLLVKDQILLDLLAKLNAAVAVDIGRDAIDKLHVVLAAAQRADAAARTRILTGLQAAITDVLMETLEDASDDQAPAVWSAGPVPDSPFAEAASGRVLRLARRS